MRRERETREPQAADRRDPDATEPEASAERVPAAGADAGSVAPDASAGRPFGAALTLMGFTVILFFCGSIAAWSVMAPLESAVVAPGTVRADSNVRTVQHLEGGIVEDILVREGDAVQAGQLLIRLRSTVPASELNEVLAQLFEARVTQARLEAERDGLDELVIPPDLREKVGDQALAAAIASQVSIFENRRALLGERLTILERTKSGLRSEVEGLEGQIRSAERRMELIREELRDTTALYEQKLAPKARVLTLERDEAELEGVVSQSRAAIATARQRMEEADLRMTELRASMATEVVEQLRDTRARAYELSQRLTAAEDKVGRTEIRSPIAGVVVGLQVHTVGGVVGAGQPLLDVVPTDDELVVQATIDPLDIDEIESGLPATVWLSAVNRRTQAPIEGRVTTVSADRLTDPRTGRDYYLARVQLDERDAERSAVPLQSGMSAEVMIRTGARTAWDYLTEPVSRSFSRALRE